MQILHLAIAEDNALALKSITKKLSSFSDITIDFISYNGKEIINQLKKKSVDVVLMDIEMPVMDGISATKEINELFPQVKVIMLTTFDDDDKIFNAILAGASGYLLKDEPAESIYMHLRNIHEGGAAMSAGIALKAIQYIRSDMKKETEGAEESILSSRETEVLIEIKNGLTYKEIGQKLNISEGTVRKHIEHIYQKLQVNNKVSALNIAKEKKWL
ncbi:MAG: response regulator transcription factor [Ferruginibacter sp.]|nr:response regulator transcription factor [Ferruginibacter sp.]